MEPQNDGAAGSGAHNEPEKPGNMESRERVKEPEEQEEPKPCLWYVLSWAIFAGVFVVYGGLWAVDRFAVRAQTSSYYGVSFPVSQYIATNQTYTASTAIFEGSLLKEAAPIAMHILYAWLMWKLPLFVFLFEMVSDQPNRVLRFLPWGMFLFITVITDSIVSVFALTGDGWTWNYTDWMFFCFYTLLGLAVVGLGNKDNNAKPAVLSTLFVLLFLALMYACYTILLPGLYWVYVQNVPNASSYLQIYLFPLFDLLLYSVLLGSHARLQEKAKSFSSMLHFLQLGYFVGMNLLVGVTEVEFYYLTAYLIFRNFFVNRVMWDWQPIVNNPACLPGWPLYYYLSYYFNSSFVIGLGRLVISKSFFTQNLAMVVPILYPIQSSLYTHNTSTPADDITAANFNSSLQGQIYWVSAIVIWAASTLSQKYSRAKPTGYMFFYYMIGVYFFYVGLLAALNIAEEGRYAFS